MKLVIAAVGLMACFVAHANLEGAADNLTRCVTTYAESQLKTTKSASSIAYEVLKNVALNSLSTMIQLVQIRRSGLV